MQLLILSVSLCCLSILAAGVNKVPYSQLPCSLLISASFPWSCNWICLIWVSFCWSWFCICHNEKVCIAVLLAQNTLHLQYCDHKLSTISVWNSLCCLSIWAFFSWSWTSLHSVSLLCESEFIYDIQAVNYIYSQVKPPLGFHCKCCPNSISNYSTTTPSHIFTDKALEIYLYSVLGQVRVLMYVTDNPHSVIA